MSGDLAPPTCSARGCTAPAVWALRWNNPRLHTPERRKTWVACEEHRESLSGFLDARGFLRERLPVEEVPVDEAPPDPPADPPDRPGAGPDDRPNG